MFPRRAVPLPLHPEDQRIVEIAKELCQQLNYYKANPQTISWRDRIGFRRAPPDLFMIFLGNIQLSKAAMGRLTPEEWRPFLASGLVYYKNLNRENLRGLLPIIALALTTPFVIFLSFRFLGPASGPPTIPIDIIVVAWMAFLIVAYVRFFLSHHKKIWFKADEQAARLVGKEPLQSSLRKIGEIDQHTRTSRRGIIRPTVEDRIAHLTSSDVVGF